MFQWKACPLFAEMSDCDIKECLACSRARVVSYEKDAHIFSQQDQPENVWILLEGSVAICSDSSAGSRNIITTLEQSGELFGEVFLFLNRDTYDFYAQATSKAIILKFPKSIFDHTCDKNCRHHSKLISNMLSILAQKAYYLNRKLQILSGTTLRKKIAEFLLQAASMDGRVVLSMNREELADFLNVARPSLSRELMNMRKEGLIDIQKNEILIRNREHLENS